MQDAHESPQLLRNTAEWHAPKAANMRNRFRSQDGYVFRYTAQKLNASQPHHSNQCTNQALNTTPGLSFRAPYVGNVGESVPRLTSFRCASLSGFRVPETARQSYTPLFKRILNQCLYPGEAAGDGAIPSHKGARTTTYRSQAYACWQGVFKCSKMRDIVVFHEDEGKSSAAGCQGMHGLLQVASLVQSKPYNPSPKAPQELLVRIGGVAVY